MKRDIFADDNLMLLIGEELVSFIEFERQTKRIKDTRTRVLADKGIMLPVVHIMDSYEIPEFDVNVVIFGTVIEERTFDPNDRNFFDDVISFVCGVIYDKAELFKDFDYEGEIIKLEKERTREGYKKILTYYTHINPNKKMQFHYLKKIASFNFPEDLWQFKDALESGLGYKASPMQARKVSYRIHKCIWRDDQVF